MLLRKFSNTVILSEEQCVEFLRENQLLVQAADYPPCARCCHVMEQKRKCDREGEFLLVLRCPQRGCQTTRSVRQGNAFFHYTDLNGRLNSQLTLCGIVELVYMFTIDMPALQVVELTGKSRGTVVDQYSWSSIHIDEARFAGRRKYNRGRILQGELSSENVRLGPSSTLTNGLHMRLNTLGFDHYTVSHQQAYVNPVTGAHTLAIERSWLDSKISSEEDAWCLGHYFSIAFGLLLLVCRSRG